MRWVGHDSRCQELPASGFKLDRQRWRSYRARSGERSPGDRSRRVGLRGHLSARDPGHVDVAGHEQVATGSWLFFVRQPVGVDEAAGRHHESGSGHGTVQPQQHAGRSRVSCAQPEFQQLAVAERVARISLVRNRGAQHEVWLSGRLSHNRHGRIPERKPCVLSVQQWRAQPVDDGHRQLADRRSDRIPRRVCAGPVDDGAANAAGGRTLRPRLELGARRAQRMERARPLPFSAHHILSHRGCERFQ